MSFKRKVRTGRAAAAPKTTQPAGQGQLAAHPVTVTSRNFRQVVLEAGDTPVLVDFWASWCMPCRMVAPALEELARELDGQAIIAKVNVDEEPELAGAAGIRSIPTLVLFRNGQVVDVLIGARPKDAIRQAILRQVRR